jgi:hypothetical protein
MDNFSQSTASSNRSTNLSSLRARNDAGSSRRTPRALTFGYGALRPFSTALTRERLWNSTMLDRLQVPLTRFRD